MCEAESDGFKTVFLEVAEPLNRASKCREELHTTVNSRLCTDPRADGPFQSPVGRVPCTTVCWAVNMLGKRKTMEPYRDVL
jgi:hypothetical protein